MFLFDNNTLIAIDADTSLYIINSMLLAHVLGDDGGGAND